jgi:ADP-ribose pyrophosphatase YjhB (NUDIX family)
MVKLFQQSEGSPFHISVGAVAVNKEGKILVHRLTKERTPARYAHMLGGLPEAYTLMHESVENGETLDDAVVRGLKEEFGATGVVTRHLGGRNFVHTWNGQTFEKTILYFEADITAEGPRLADDEESFTEVVWVELPFLLERMRDQAAHSSRPQLDETKIIEAYLKYGKNT